MDVVRLAPTISDDNKQIFNQVRLFLKVEKAADIVDLSKGNILCSNIYQGKNTRNRKKMLAKCTPFPK